MKLRPMFCLGMLLLGLAATAHAQNYPYDEYSKDLRADREVTPLTSTLFGDQVSLYNGAVEFDVTDVNLPGNSDLPVRFGRRFVVSHADVDGHLGGLGDWSIEVPYIDGVFTYEDGWEVQNPDSTPTDARCSVTTAPYTIMPADVNNGVEEPVVSIWDGDQLHIPGTVDEELLANTESQLPKDADGQSYPWITKSFYTASCASSTANGYPGESFVVVSPSGVRYTMNQVLVNANAALIFKVPAPSGKGTVTETALRSRIFMLATEVQDRFGNWVKYTYNSASQLTKILANDGREIDIAWSGNEVSSVTAGTRIWRYGYTSNDTLSTVTKPDGTQWTYTYTSGSLDLTRPTPDREPLPTNPCQTDPVAFATGSLVYTVGSPSGAQGTFDFAYQTHYHAYVPLACPGANPGNIYPPEYDFFNNFTLQSKQITGAGLTAQNWTYDYDGVTGGYVNASVSYDYYADPYIPTSSAPLSPPGVVTVTDPSGVTKYYFGVNYGIDEGRLFKTEFYTPTGTLEKTVTNTYLDESAVSGQAFPGDVGQMVEPLWKHPMSNRLRPVVSTVITQDGGDTYTHQNLAFDVFAQPTEVSRYSNVAGQAAITEQTTYDNDLTHWVLGLPQQVENLGTGDIESLDTYDPTTDLLASNSRFGEQLLSYTYNSAGQLASFTDGNANTTYLSNYYRGIPQQINYPDGTSQSATVDNYGEIVTVTDQAGHVTTYQYDPAGWPTEIDYPTGDELAWLPQTFDFSYVTTAERGIAGGHWRRTVSTGNNVEVTYFDAMLRPLLTDGSITGTAGSDISAGNSYDWRGLTTFAAYPVAGAPDLSALTTGTHTSYDTLGRPIQTLQDSEQGTLTSTTAYLPGAAVQVTDPRGKVTTTHYQVFDAPSTRAPIEVDAPEGVTQTIARDIYGKPLSITQSGVYNGTETDSVTKTLVYDIYQRLCRTTEPETGDSSISYDGANNVRQTASGLALTEAGCARDQVPSASATNYTHDAMNRLQTVLPPAGTQSTSYHYTPTGKVDQAVSGNSTWSAHYNYRDMLTDETLAVTGQDPRTIAYAHDAYGDLAQLSYPDGESVAYAPDARGRPTQVGGYASQIGYFPNGQVSGFVYGNGTAYAAAQNTRQLLSNFSYGHGSTLNLSEDMSYDPNGNILTVQDLVSGQRSKTFQYDGLNRLTSAVAPALWGTEQYTYDPLNNLRTRLTAGQTNVYTYGPTNQLASITRAGSTIGSFGYDNLGNETNRNGATLQFDQKNQLLQIPGVDSYQYDATGRRTVKTAASGGASTYTFYDHAGQLLYQIDQGTSQATDFIYLGSRMIARDASLHLGAPGAITFDSNPNNGNYTVSWGAVPLATSYLVQEQANGGAWTTVYSGSATSAAMSGKTAGSYVYQVQACAGSTYSDETGSATLGVWPATPTNLAGPTVLTYAPFTVSWTASPGVASYTVQQSFNGGAWTTLASGISTPSYSVTTAPGGTYTYQVMASNTYGSSSWTAAAPVSVTQVPDTPTHFTVSTSNGITVLGWDAMTWATSYKLTAAGSDGNLGTYTYVVGTNSFNFRAGKYKAEQLTACSIAGCSAPLIISNGLFTVGGAGTGDSDDASAATPKARRLGADTSVESGCTAATCTAVLGGNP